MKTTTLIALLTLVIGSLTSTQAIAQGECLFDDLDYVDQELIIEEDHFIEEEWSQSYSSEINMECVPIAPQPIRRCGTPEPPAMVEIFQHSDFQGMSTPIPGDWTAHNWDDYWNDKISSISIPDGFEVTIYEHANFQGRSLTLTGNWTVFAWNDFWNDRISSIQVRQVPRWGYNY